MSEVINKTQHTDDDLRAILALVHHSLMHVTSKMVAMRMQCSRYHSIFTRSKFVTRGNLYIYVYLFIQYHAAGW